MAKRDPEIEAPDETASEVGETTVGERLRAAREAKGLSLEDIAAQTRIPQRHLESIETADWNALPAPTYTTGFAKSYASAVGLDRTEIGDQLRAEMGGQRFTANTMESFEPADPRRTMPKWLVLGTIGGLLVLIVLMSWLNNRSLQQPEQSTAPAAEAPAPTAQSQTPVRATVTPAAANAPVVLTATAPVWLQVSDKAGGTLFSGTLQPGQTYQVPATATAPVLKTGKPEALTVKVGNQTAPAVGPAATTVHVSLLAGDLMKGPGAAPAPAASKPRARAAHAVSAPAAAGESSTATNTAE